MVDHCKPLLHKNIPSLHYGRIDIIHHTCYNYTINYKEGNKLAINMGHKPTLSEETVLKLRDWYWRDLWSYSKLARNFDITPDLARKAVQGRGCYASIKDDISQETKDFRVPERQRYAKQPGISQARKARLNAMRNEAEQHEIHMQMRRAKGLRTY